MVGLGQCSARRDFTYGRSLSRAARFPTLYSCMSRGDDVLYAAYWEISAPRPTYRRSTRLQTGSRGGCWSPSRFACQGFWAVALPAAQVDGRRAQQQRRVKQAGGRVDKVGDPQEAFDHIGI